MGQGPLTGRFQALLTTAIYQLQQAAHFGQRFTTLHILEKGLQGCPNTLC
jgi:hypothetical protein